MGRKDGAHYAVDNFWKHDVRQPENMLRVVKYYGFDAGEHGWNEWYKKNKTTKTPMECSLRLLLMKALNRFVAVPTTYVVIFTTCSGAV